MKRNPFFFLMILGMTFLFACQQSPQEFGIIEGHVTIGPLVPVVRAGEAEATPSPEVYAAREIVIFMENGRLEFTRIKIDSLGNYRAELPAGTYVVDINHLGIDTAEGLPRKIVIASQGNVTLDINIDTGIR